MDEIDLSVLREVGNARSNAIWEHSLAVRHSRLVGVVLLLLLLSVG